MRALKPMITKSLINAWKIKITVDFRDGVFEIRNRLRKRAKMMAGNKTRVVILVPMANPKITPVDRAQKRSLLAASLITDTKRSSLRNVNRFQMCRSEQIG